MKTEISFPQGLPTDMEDAIFDHGMAFTEWLAATFYVFMVSGAFRNEIDLHTDVRMK